MKTIQTHQRFNPGALRPSAGDDTTTTVATPQPPAVGGVKKLAFGNIAAKKESTKTAYPVFPDANGQAAALAATIIRQNEEFEALKGSLETNKAELKFMVAPAYFELNRGKHEVPSSVSVASTEGEVLVTFQNRYKALDDESAVLPILGDRTGEFFRQAFELKINGDKLPADRAQALLDEISALFTRFHCAEALELKAVIKPTTEFHAARHLVLTPEQNLALDQACPIVAMIKTKGRR